MRKPVLITVISGFVCGILFVPGHWILSSFLGYRASFCLILMLYLLIYALYLVMRNEKSPLIAVFPMLFLGVAGFGGCTAGCFAILTVVVFSWIRVNVEDRFTLRGLMAEIVFAGGGAVLVAMFSTHTTGSWAMGIWAFFLTQSLYYMTGDSTGSRHIDTFTEAKNKAASIVENY